MPEPTLDQPATAVRQARNHLAAARTIERNQRLRRYNGRNAGLTESALSHHYGAAAIAESALPRELRGLLWAEHDLAERLSVARDCGQNRPELRKRLAATRRELKAGR